MSRLNCSSFARSTQTVPLAFDAPAVPTAPVADVELEVELVEAPPSNASICAATRAIAARSVVPDAPALAVVAPVVPVVPVVPDVAVLPDSAGGWLVMSVCVVGWVWVEWLACPVCTEDEDPACVGAEVADAACDAEPAACCCEAVLLA